MSIADTLSIQLYSLRNYADLDAQLDALAGMGFKRVETVGGHFADAKATRAKLDARGLKALTGHVGMADLRTRPDWVAEQALTVGVQDLFMPAVPPDERNDRPADYWRSVGDELAEMSGKLAKHGVKLGYHNHHWELKPYADGTRPLQLLFDAAQGSALTWQADVAWLVRGDVDPVAWMERYKSRLVAVHVKDLAPTGQNLDEDGWADVGKGRLDWKRLWAESTARGARHMVLEHDKPSDPIRFAKDSRVWLLANIA